MNQSLHQVLEHYANLTVFFKNSLQINLQYLNNDNTATYLNVGLTE